MNQHSLMTILAVDDDKVMLALMEETIKTCLNKNVQITTTTDPIVAREKLETGIIDLLLTDLEMPGLNGIALLRCAKRRNAWTQVVILTGHSEKGALTEAMDLGASDYLIKPVNLDELELVLKESYARLQRWRKALVSTFAR